MLTPKPIIIFILFFVCLTIIPFILKSSNKQNPAYTSATNSSALYFLANPNDYQLIGSQTLRFVNPLLALQILKVLDPPALHLSEKDKDKLPDWTMDLRFNKDPDYCEKSRQYFAANPSAFLSNKNLFTDVPVEYFLRQEIFPSVGLHDVYPEYENKKESANIIPQFELMPTINSFYLHSLWPKDYLIGQNYGCSHQIVNQIISINSTFAKSKLADTYKNYHFDHKSQPRCQPNFMPETFLLKNKTQCVQFFEYLNSNAYAIEKEKYSISFIKKELKGLHRGRGVDVLDEEAEANLRRLYENGILCGSITDKILMQRYIWNPLLLEKHKFDFRVYMLIASTDPLIVYYHDGFLRVSLHEYDIDSKERAVHLTNTDISKNIFKLARNSTWNGMNETELRDFQMWNFEEFQEYLISAGKIKDSKWLDTYLRPQIKKAMIHLIRMTQHKLGTANNMYQLCGFDFILDNDLKLWFIEANIRPALAGTSKEKEKFMINMINDHFEIMFSLLKSRMKRVINYINKIIEEHEPEVIIEGIDKLENFKQIKKGFDMANKNKIEDEFQISEKNGFEKIVDENLNGVDRYEGLVDKKCV